MRREASGVRSEKSDHFAPHASRLDRVNASTVNPTTEASVKPANKVTKRPASSGVALAMETRARTTNRPRSHRRALGPRKRGIVLVDTRQAHAQLWTASIRVSTTPIPCSVVECATRTGRVIICVDPDIANPYHAVSGVPVDSAETRRSPRSHWGVRSSSSMRRVRATSVRQAVAEWHLGGRGSPVEPRPRNRPSRPPRVDHRRR